MSNIDKIKAIQEILEVEADGIIGPITRAAFESLGRGASDWVNAKASSFADPADIAAYVRCRAKGRTKAQCLKVGDNGEGYWGDNTTAPDPQCALNKTHIVKKWGSMAKGKHKLVDVQIDGQIVTCKLTDTGAPQTRIDLNPGAVAEFGLEPPILVKAKWRWA